jgi:hypothetical protein
MTLRSETALTTKMDNSTVPLHTSSVNPEVVKSPFPARAVILAINLQETPNDPHRSTSSRAIRRIHRQTQTNRKGGITIPTCLWRLPESYLRRLGSKFGGSRFRRRWQIEANRIERRIRNTSRRRTRRASMLAVRSKTRKLRPVAERALGSQRSR